MQMEPPPASLALGPKPLAAGDSAGARLLSALPAVITEEAGDATIATTTIGGSSSSSSSSSSSWQPAEAPPAVGADEEQGGSGPQPLSSPAPRCRRTHVGMVGDGANDAAALAAADVGIAVRGGPGGGDSALAAGAAGVVVLLDGQGRGGRGSLRRIPQAIDLAAAVRAVVLENVALAVAVKFALLLVLLVGCAAWGQQRRAGARGQGRSRAVDGGRERRGGVGGGRGQRAPAALAGAARVQMMGCVGGSFEKGRERESNGRRSTSENAVHFVALLKGCGVRVQ